MAKRKTKAQKEAEAKALAEEQAQVVEEQPETEVVETEEQPEVVEEQPETEEQSGATEEQPETTEEQPEVVETALTEADIRDVLLNGKGLEDIHEALKNASLVASTVNTLKRYVDSVYDKFVGQPARIASMNYDLYREFIAVANGADVKTMKLNYDLIIRVFELETSKFNAASLARYDVHWTNGANAFRNYTGIIKLLTSIANDPKKRSSIKKIYGSERILELYPESARGNIIKYFNL